MNPLLSILIPTKNRYEYLKVILEIFRNFSSSELEIVVQDNSDKGIDQENFSIFINKLEDIRIKYFYCDEFMSINENSDKAVLNSKGKFVCFIGDDDCVTSHIISVAKWMERESIDVCTFNCAAYIWQDVEYKYLSKKHAGVLSFVKPTGKVEFKNPRQELDNLLRKGGQSLNGMPHLYHGIASRAVLDKIFETTGSYFPGSVPDMDVAVCLSLFSTNFFKIDVPVVISGIAKKSGAGLGAAKMHKGDINKIPTLPKYTAKTWSPYIPFFWSGPTIYADSMHKCLIRTGNESFLEKFNYNYLYAVLFIFHNDYYHEIRKAMSNNKKTSILKIFYHAFLLFFIRSFYFIKNRVPGIIRSKGNKISISSITEAEEHIERIIDKMFLTW